MTIMTRVLPDHGENKMNKRLFATLAILALFTLAAFAYTRTTTTKVAGGKACCCKSADSCPMMAKGHDAKSGDHAKMSCCAKHGDDHEKGGEHAKGEGHTCCGDSCPMKKGEKPATSEVAGMKATAAAEGHSCCCCSGESCDMKKGEKTATAAPSADKSCCDDRACCKEKATTTT